LIELVQKNIYRIEIPLPNTPLKTVNNYFIQGTDRNLWIDTAYNNPDCRKIITEAISLLNVDFSKTDVFLTHKHEDHSGLVNFITAPNSEILASESTIKMLNTGEHSVSISDMRIFFERNTPDYEEMFKMYISQIEHFKTEPINQNLRILRQGDVLSIKPFRFNVIETPGHDNGHLCLFEENSGILFSGDHILGSITPNVSLWLLEKDVIAEYLASLDKINALKINLVLPGHRYTFTDCQRRIDQIKEYHENQLEKILQIFSCKDDKDFNDLFLTANDVANKIKRGPILNCLDEFSYTQKVFATGEAGAHLYHLEKSKLMKSVLHNNLIYYYNHDTIS